MLTIKTKIILAVNLVLGVALIASALFIYRSTKSTELTKLDARLESHAEKIQTELEEQFEEHQFLKPEDIREISTEGLSDIKIRLCDTTGMLVYGDSTLQIAEDKLRISSIAGKIWNVYTRDSISYRVLIVPVDAEQNTSFLLEIAASMTEMNARLDQLACLFMISIPLTLLLSALVIYLITRTAFKPLTTMASAAQKISANNLTQRLDVPTANDEVKMLAESLNRMVTRIESAFLSQKQFVADASHEIRTPLTVITSELEYAQTANSKERLQESITISLTEIEKLTRMTEGLLFLTRFDTAQVNLVPVTFRLDELIIEVVQFLHRLSEAKNLKTDLFIQEAVEVCADRGMIRRAIINIVDNAIKYSLSGGVVTIELRTSADDKIILLVCDGGPGISELDKPRLFKRFYRGEATRGTTEGSGLGLVIARKVIELNDGAITIESADNKGTLVTIELPKPKL